MMCIVCDQENVEFYDLVEPTPIDDDPEKDIISVPYDEEKFNHEWLVELAA